MVNFAFKFGIVLLFSFYLYILQIYLFQGLTAHVVRNALDLHTYLLTIWVLFKL